MTSSCDSMVDKGMPYSALRASRAFFRWKRISVSIRAVGRLEKILPTYLTIVRVYEIILPLSRFQNMDIRQTVKQIMGHLNHETRAGTWFVGTRVRARIHQYDEEHLPFPTCSWISHEMENPADAAEVVRELVSHSAALRHVSTQSNGGNVFAYFVRNGLSHNESPDHD